MFIYVGTNTVNGKRYVGQTRRSLRERLYRHKHTALFSSKPRSALHHAIHKYGWEVFTWEVVQVCDSLEALDEAEREWVDRLQALAPSGYNLTVGGNAGGTRSQATKDLIRAQRTGKRHTEASVAKMRASATAENLSDETRAKMSRAQSNRSAEHLAAQRRGQANRSVEWRTNHSAAMRKAPPLAKLDWTKVAAIRLAHATGTTDRDLAAEHGVHIRTLQDVVKSRTWVTS